LRGNSDGDNHRKYWANSSHSLQPSKRELKRELKRNARITKRIEYRLDSKLLPRNPQNRSISESSGSATPTAIARRKRAAEANSAWLGKAKNGPTILIDCSWEANMSQREIRSLVQQIKLCYGANRASTRPAQLVLTSVSGDTHRGLAELSGWGSWFGVRATSASLESLLDQSAAGANGIHNSESLDVSSCAVAPMSEASQGALEVAVEKQMPRLLQPSRMVYLTADSSADLCPYDEPLPWRAETTYVIGGIVKGVGLRRAAIARAEGLGISTVRLPLHRFLSEKRHVTSRDVGGLAKPAKSGSENIESDDVPQVEFGQTIRGTFAVATALEVTEGFSSTFTVNRVCELLLLKAVNDEAIGAETRKDGTCLGSWATALASVVPKRHRS